ncbi:toll/interleukin-1 receptor domain-containing protein [Glaciecola sp. 1036]|uniref:toll/interleukin-1 receptor domain-containing protein n=1 Tax=Alteromonadaceae TaxID=72275 RepID=UPI003D0389DF
MDENNQPQYKYHAFISYRHADNKEQGRQWATWLHQAIETYEVPNDLVGKKNGRGDVIPARIYPIFRDEEELPAHADLATSIVSALEQTNLLVVLCSPRAVASTYVADEIDYFKKLGHSDRIIAAMIDGEPNTSWDDSKHSLGFTKADECLPLPLQFEYDQDGNPTYKRAEPIAADFRINNDGKPEQGFTTPAAYREHLKKTTSDNNRVIQEKVNRYQQQLHLMLLKIIAGILGVPLGELTQRDKEYQLEQARLKAKRFKKWLSVFVILISSALVLAFFLYQQYEETKLQAAIAEQKEIARKNNLSEFLLSQAEQSSSESKLAEAAFHALNALQETGDNQSKIIPEVANHLMRYFNSPRVLNSKQVFPKKVCEEVERIEVVSFGSGSKSDSSKVECDMIFENKINSFELASDEKSIFYSGRDAVNKTIEQVDLKGNEIAKYEAPAGEYFNLFALTSNNKQLVAASNKHLLVYNVVSQEETHKYPLKNKLSCLYIAESQQRAIACTDRSIFILDIETGDIIKTIEFENGIEKIEFSESSNLLAIVADVPKRTFRYELVFYDSKTLDKVPSKSILLNQSLDVKFTPDGSYIVVPTERQIKIYDVMRLWNLDDGYLELGTLKDTYEFGRYDKIGSVYLGPYNGRNIYEHKNGAPYPNFFMVVSFENKVEFWNTYHHRKEASIEGLPDLNAAVLSTDGRKLYTAHEDNTIKTWELFSDRQVMESESSIDKIKFPPYNNSLISIGSDLQLWNLSSNKSSQTISLPIKSFDDVISLGFAENKQSMGAITEDGKYFSISLQPKLQIIKTLATEFSLGTINDRNDLIAGLNSVNEIEVINLNTNARFSIPKLPSAGQIEKIAFSGKQDQLIILYDSDFDNLIELINIKEPKQRKSLKENLTAAEYFEVSENGKILLLWNDEGQAKLIDLQKDYELFVWEFEKNIENATISKDSYLVAIAFENGEVIVFDSLMGDQIAKINIEVGYDDIENIEFSKNDNKLTVNVEEKIIVLDLTPIIELTNEEYMKENIEKLKFDYGFDK